MTATTPVEFKPRDCYTRRGERKVAFESKREAKRIARLLPEGEPHVYRCPYCRAWHVGNDKADTDE